MCEGGEAIRPFCFCPMTTRRPLKSSSTALPLVAGIDVGGPAKGFHGVMLRGRLIVDTLHETDASAMARWCGTWKARVIGIDAPCGWSRTGGSRAGERALAELGIRCFATPTEERADGNRFYDWVRNGLRLYAALGATHRLYDGRRGSGRICFETFPHAIACSLAGRVIPARSKATIRRALLRGAGYDIGQLKSIDHVDAALCAHAAREFTLCPFLCLGNPGDGFIVTPAWRHASA